MARLILIGVLASLVIAACGGSNEYDAEATLDCLSGAGFSEYSTDGADLDLIAEEYTGRAARFSADGGEVHVIVASNESEAKNATSQYEVFAAGFGEDAVIERDGNAVIAANALEDSTLSEIKDCLT